MCIKDEIQLVYHLSGAVESVFLHFYIDDLSLLTCFTSNSVSLSVDFLLDAGGVNRPSGSSDGGAGDDSCKIIVETVSSKCSLRNIALSWKNET